MAQWDVSKLPEEKQKQVRNLKIVLGVVIVLGLIYLFARLLFF